MMAIGGELAARRARMEERARMTPEARAAHDAELWRELERRHNRAEIAQDARRHAAKRGPSRRELLDPPRYSQQYAPAGSTLAARDGRLVDGAARALDLIRARIGKNRFWQTTKSYIGQMLTGPHGRGRSERTVQRYLRALVECGYIWSTVVTNARGAIVGQRLMLTSFALPFYDAPDQGEDWNERKNGGFPGETALSPIKTTFKNRTLLNADECANGTHLGGGTPENTTCRLEPMG
jgi:hypothetical protein